MASRFSWARSTSPTLHRESTVYEASIAQNERQLHWNDPSRITPYVAKRGRLSQVWINRWTVLLFLVLVRLLLAIADYKDTVHDAEREALSACTSVESIGSNMASMPHYMSRGVNELTAHGVEKAINGLISMLSMSVTAVEALVLFAIHILTQTYLCLITFAITGSLHIALQLIEDATNFLNNSIGTIEGDIRDKVGHFEDLMNGFTSTLSDIPDIFGGDHQDIPTLDLDDQLDALNNLRIPADVDQGIQDLNNSIPTFAQVNGFVDNAIKFPFEQLRKFINESVGNYTFDHTLLPVPEKEQLSFCSENNGIVDFFDDLIKLGILARKIAIAVLVVVAVLVCIPMALREIRRWRTMEERAQIINRNAYNPLDVVYIASRPYTAGAGLRLGDSFSAPRRQYLARWVVAYATTEPALFVLSLAIAGLFSSLCQYILLKAVEKQVPDLAHQVGAFADKVVTSLDHASAEWANGTNAAILGINGKINEDMLGWVNISTTAMNNTLNTFVDETMNVLNSTFGGTVLYDPLKEVFNCLIGLKIAGIERGLTWVSDHAHVDFPLLPNNTFSLSGLSANSNDPDATSFLADPSSGTEDRVTGAASRLVDKMADHIRTETIISTCLLAVWLIVLFLGVGRALMLALGKKQISEPYPVDTTEHAHEKSAATAYQEPLPPPPAPPAREHAFHTFKPQHEQDDNPFADPQEHHPHQQQQRGGVPSFAFFHSPPPSGNNNNDTYKNNTNTTIKPVDNSATEGVNAGNTYKGTAYTLAPRPPPTFPSTTTTTNNNNEHKEGTDERLGLGYAGARSVPGTRKATHARKSSHAQVQMGGATPRVGNDRGPDRVCDV